MNCLLPDRFPANSVHKTIKLLQAGPVVVPREFRNQHVADVVQNVLWFANKDVRRTSRTGNCNIVQRIGIVVIHWWNLRNDMYLLGNELLDGEKPDPVMTLQDQGARWPFRRVIPRSRDGCRETSYSAMSRHTSEREICNMFQSQRWRRRRRRWRRDTISPRPWLNRWRCRLEDLRDVVYPPAVNGDELAQRTALYSSGQRETQMQ